MGWDESSAKTEPTTRGRPPHLNKIKIPLMTEPQMKVDSLPWNNPSPAKEVPPGKLDGILVF